MHGVPTPGITLHSPAQTTHVFTRTIMPEMLLSALFHIARLGWPLRLKK